MTSVLPVSLLYIIQNMCKIQEKSNKKILAHSFLNLEYPKEEKKKKNKKKQNIMPLHMIAVCSVTKIVFCYDLEPAAI